MVKIIGHDKNGNPVDIYCSMPNEPLPDLIKYLLNQDTIKVVSIEKEKEDEHINS